MQITSAPDLAKYDLIRLLRRESQRLCEKLDRDLEVRKGLTREAFRLARAELKRAKANESERANASALQSAAHALNN